MLQLQDVGGIQIFCDDLAQSLLCATLNGEEILCRYGYSRRGCSGYPLSGVQYGCNGEGFARYR